MIKLALLSTWHVHTDWFLGKLRDSGLADFVIMWDEDPIRGKRFAEEHGIPFEDMLEKVLSRQDVEGVVVECPTTRHTEVICKAANAGKHIFSDKALTLTMAEYEKMETAIKENKVKFLLSLESKSIGIYQYAAELANTRKLGRITSAYFRRAHQALLDPHMLPKYWFDTTQSGGGVTLDLGCHGLYLLPMFCGKPKKVTSRMGNLYGSKGDELSSTVIEFENGAIGTAFTSYVSYRQDNLLEIMGTEGSIIVVGTEKSNFTVLLQSKNIPGYENMRQIPHEDIPEDREFPIVDFVRLIRSEKDEAPEYGLKEAKNLTRLIECAYESARRGKTVLF